MAKTITWFLVFCCICTGYSLAKEKDSEDFHIEFSVGGWPLKPSGNVQSGSTSVDFKSDLGIGRQTATFAGKVVLKPLRKHRFLFEAIPYRLEGSNTLTRSVDYGGVTFTQQDQITSRAELNYIFAGYQHDLVSLRFGHFGLLSGIAYLDATGTVNDTTAGTSSSRNIKLPMPLTGAEFRVWPIPGHNLLNLNGEFKGMSIGPFGTYIHWSANLGISLGRHLTLQGGYSVVDADLHTPDRTKSMRSRFAGPVYTLQFRN